MYKLKNSYIDTIIEQKTTSKEIDFILYIARFQDEQGVVESVYYKDICNTIDVSIQKFYDILNSLQSKGLITYQKVNRADIRVQFVLNDFSQSDFHEGYLNVATTDFQEIKFRKMKAGSKLLYLYIQRFRQGKHMLVQNFYESFCEIFHVAQKSLQIYLHELKKNYYLFISKKRNKSYNYEMTMKISTVLKIKTYIPTERDFYINNVANLVKRNFNKYVPKKNADRVVSDIANLAVTNKAAKYKNLVSLIVTAIRHSIDKQHRERKKSPVLNAALINSCLSDVIEYEFMKKYGLA